MNQQAIDLLIEKYEGIKKRSEIHPFTVMGVSTAIESIIYEEIINDLKELK